MAQVRRASRSRPTSRCSRSRRTRSTPRCRAASGIVTQILVQEGETVEVGTKLAVIGEAGAPAAEPEAPPEPATAEAAAEAQAASSAETAAPAPRPARTGSRTAAGRRADERRAGFEELRLPGRRAHRGRAQRRRVERPGHGSRGTSDEEGHPPVRRVRCRRGSPQKRLLPPRPLLQSPLQLRLLRLSPPPPAAEAPSKPPPAPSRSPQRPASSWSR